MSPGEWEDPCKIETVYEGSENTLAQKVGLMQHYNMTPSQKMQTSEHRGESPWLRCGMEDAI